MHLAIEAYNEIEDRIGFTLFKRRWVDIRADGT